MLPDPDDMIVTTGGQQAIDLVTQDPGRPRRRGDLRGADLPRRGAGLLQLRGRRDPGRDRRRRDADRRARSGCSSELRARRAAAEVHLLGAELPEPGRGDDVARAARSAWSSSRGEHELLVVEDNPYGLLRYDGEPLPPLYQLDGGDFVIYLGTFSKILSPGIRLGWAVAPPPVMEKIVLGKQAADLCTSTLTQYFVREYFAEGRWRELRRRPGRDLPRPPRRDARGAARALPGGGDLDRTRRAASSSGRRCPTTSTPATCWRRRCAPTSPSSPARPPTSTGAARNSMRLNFSGVDRGRDPRGDPPHRRRDRRAGRALRER